MEKSMPQARSPYASSIPLNAPQRQWERYAPPAYNQIYPESSAQAGSQQHATQQAPRIDPTRLPMDPTSPATSEEDSVLTQALEFTSHRVPSYARNARLLEKPIAVPQVSDGLGVPFARAYSEVLMERGVSMEEFVEFVDNLNTVSAGSPPLEALNAAGGLVGMIPYHHAQWISAGIQAGAQLGKAAISATRLKLFMKEVNEKFFASRGLRVEIMNGEALRMKLGMSSQQALTVPMSDDRTVGMTMHERKVVAVALYIAPLSFDVPPPNEPSRMLDHMNAASQKRTLAKQEKSAVKSRTKYEEKSSKQAERMDKKHADFQKELEKLEAERKKLEDDANRKREKALKSDKPGRVEKRLREVERELEKEVRHIDRDIEKVSKVFEKVVGKMEKDLGKDDKEEKKGCKVQWIVVDNL